MIFELRRRQLMAGSAAFLLAKLARAQPANKSWRIGILSARSQPAALDQDANFARFLRGMRELGYVENKNVRFDARFAGGETARLPALAQELALLKPDVIVTAGNQAIAATMKAAPDTPIVIATSIDPVGSGFVNSLAHPGGWVTGLSNLTSEVSVKHIEFLSTIVPGLSKVAVLIDPTNSAHETVVKSLRTASVKAHVDLVVTKASAREQIDEAFVQMVRNQARALVVVVDGLFTQQAEHIAALAIKAGLPSIDASGALARAGGLAGYGQDFGDNYYRAASFVDKILKGAKPGELPIEQSSRFTLVLNMKTARTLGLSIPQSVMLRADQVIE